PSWPRLADDDAERIARPLAEHAEPCLDDVTLAHLRADRDAAAARLAAAESEMLRILEGERLATLDAARFFAEAIETEEELEAALDALRAAFAPLLAQGRRVVVR
ncbi:MAG: hypothetical protein HQL41_11850, partial [Alphaproteobacteria bacterium]|nr:hypothetical protein [Alphaproteobacteria bacterium]